MTRSHATLIVILSSLLAGTACRSSTPRYAATSVPIDVGAGLRFCVAIDPADPAGVWWWGPGTTGCATRSTGPGLMHGDRAAVQAREGSRGVDARFRVGLIRGPDSRLPEFLDVHLVLADGSLSSPATGARVAIERRNDLEVPERP